VRKILLALLKKESTFWHPSVDTLTKFDPQFGKAKQRFHDYISDKTKYGNKKTEIVQKY
jgi:hypothetical protein